MAKQENKSKPAKSGMSLGDQLTASLISAVPGVIDTVTKSVTTIMENRNAPKETAPVVQKADAVKASDSKPSPCLVWEGIGCSTKTAMFIEMSLADGVIDQKERSLIVDRARAENVDLRELDFLIDKRLEANELVNRNAIKELSAFFKEAESIAAKEVKHDMSEMSAKVPAFMSSGVAATPGGQAVMVTSAVFDVVGKFIKEPSKLNEFKAEIIRMIEIPMLPAVISDFFAYANSQIIQERQKVAGKGYFAIASEALFGKELELEPIWIEKMKHVMSKVVARYGNDHGVMESVKPYRVTPLKKFMEIRNDNDAILTFPVPKLAPDFIELMRYVFKLSQDARLKKGALSDAYYHLCMKMHKDGQPLAARFPEVASVLKECRVSALTDLVANTENPDFLIMFNLPEDYVDVCEVLQYVAAKPQLRDLHKRLYNQAQARYKSEPDRMDSLKQYKPKGLFGF